MRLRGAAWDGDGSIRRVDVSIDYGARWRPAQLQPPKNRYDWRRWTATVPLPSDGYYEIWTRATDQRGNHAAACRRQLESARLWRQSDASDRDLGRLAVAIIPGPVHAAKVTQPA